MVNTLLIILFLEMQNRIKNFLFIIVSILEITRSAQMLQQCFWVEKNSYSLLRQFQYPSYNRCILIDQNKHNQNQINQFQMLQDHEIWLRAGNYRISCMGRGKKCFLLQEKENIEGQIIKINGNTYYFIFRNELRLKMEIYEESLETYFIKKICEIIFISLYLFLYDLTNRKNSLIKLVLFTLIQFTLVRFIVITAYQNELWKYNQIILLIILNGICLFKIIQIIEGEMDHSKDISLELKVISFCVMIMIKAWRWQISLISFIFVMNAQFLKKQKENQMIEKQSQFWERQFPIQQILRYYAFMGFHLTLCHNYSINVGFILQSSTLLFTMILNIHYLYHRCEDNKPKFYKLQIHEKAKLKEPCPICLQTFSSKLIQTQCGHIYHFQCLQQWLMNSKSCPIDRNVLDTSMIQ